MNNIILKSAIRSVLSKKNIKVAGINIFGLTIATLAFLLVVHYWVFETSSDKFIPAHENVYRVNMTIKEEGREVFNGALTPRQLYFAVRNEIPDVEANGLAYFESCLVARETNRFSKQRVLWVDEGFEKVFPFSILYGEADFSKPLTGILSETKAKNLFGDQNPVGKIIEVNQGMKMEVTGVYKDLPSNTHLDADYFFSINTFVHFGWMETNGDWEWPGFWNYIRVKPDADPIYIEASLNDFVDKYMGFLQERNQTALFAIQSLTDLHYVRGLQGERGASTIPSSLIRLILVGIMVMAIAWINFINLSTAQSSERISKIKIRRLVGASFSHLWQQVLIESLLVSLLSTIIAFILYQLLIPVFGNYFEVPLDKAFMPGQMITIFLLISFFIGLIGSSIYSSAVLFKQGNLKGKNQQNNGGLKKGFVIAQLAFSMIFISGSIVVYKQINFMQNYSLGMSLNQVVNLTAPASNNGDEDRRSRYLSFRSEALRIPGVLSGTALYNIPGEEPELKTLQFVRPDAGLETAPEFRRNDADNGMLETYSLKLISGKNFSEHYQLNKNRVLINEYASRLLEFRVPEDAIGKRIYDLNNRENEFEIVGVLADFHNEGMNKPLYPMVWIDNHPWTFGFYNFKIDSKHASTTIAQLQETFKYHYPDDPFEFSFAENDFNQQYQSEARFGKFYLILTFLSLVISGLGLFGLLIFYLNVKKKEIGIRKVNGARISEVMSMLNIDFIKWVAIAFIIATPVAYYTMNKWLENFAYKTSLSWWIFALAGLLALGIALLTVSWQSWRAATRNPVEALRYE